MKTSEFKKILKPLIEQAVKEVLLKEGVLSKVVAEVARGLNQLPPLKFLSPTSLTTTVQQSTRNKDKKKLKG